MTVAPDPAGRPPHLLVRLGCDEALAARAAWALEALLARAGVRRWRIDDGAGEPAAGEVVLGYGAPGDVELPHDAGAWALRREEPPVGDPLAETFWHLARVEELDAPDEVHDAHGRFRMDASWAVRAGHDPAAFVPVDDHAAALARQLALPWPASTPVLVPTHDVDLPWRWTRAGRRRAARAARDAWRGGERRDALLSLLALAGAPLARLRGRDPWCNAAVADQLAARSGAVPTHYLLLGGGRPEDGDTAMLDHGRPAYARQLLRPARRGAGSRLPSGRVGLHASYAALEQPALIATELAVLEDELAALAGSARQRPSRRAAADAREPVVRDHRFHYLRHRPAEAWPVLAAAGLRSDASLGWAEAPGFRAGTAHPFRAWDHGAGRPLPLVVLPLALMDASFDARYLDLAGRADVDARREHLDRVLATLARTGGTATALWHNDRLAGIDRRRWRDDWSWLLARWAIHHGGEFDTAGGAALSALAALPPGRADG